MRRLVGQRVCSGLLSNKSFDPTSNERPINSDDMPYPHSPRCTNTSHSKAQGEARAGRMGAAEKRSALAGARSAHQHLTCRRCLSGTEWSEFLRHGQNASIAGNP